MSHIKVTEITEIEILTVFIQDGCHAHHIGASIIPRAVYLELFDFFYVANQSGMDIKSLFTLVSARARLGLQSEPSLA